MINILLIDDEYLIRAKLIKYLKDSPFQINCIYEASNGVEGLKIIKNTSIDVALVDIQMPLLTGIEFIKRLREELYDTKIIFLTGFEKFEYAKQAIKYDAIDYLLKPIKKDELYNALSKCISLISSERKNLIALMEVNEKEKYQFLVDSLYDYCDYNSSPLNVSKNDFLVVSIEVHENSSISYLYKFLNNTFKNYDVICGLNKRNKILIINCTYSDYIKQLFKGLINDKILTYCYFSNLNNSSKNLKDLFFKCITVFPSKIFFPKYSIFNFEDINYKSFELPNNLKLDFELSTKSESKSFILYKLDSYIKEIEKLKDINALKILLTNFLTALENIVSKENDSLAIINIDYIVNNLLYSSNSLEDVKKYCYNCYDNVISCSKINKSSDSTKNIKSVKEFIDKNYTSENINLDFLSKKFYINSCHLSSTFKKVTGESIIEYITKMRITKAKKLLEANEIKLSEVSEKIGYKDYYYFSKIFKKHVGIPPIKYKQSIFVN